MSPQICFRDHVGLPGQPNPPTVDGFVEPEDFLETGFGSTPSQVDTGWTQAARITYVADVSVGAGRPLTVFQCLKQNGADFVYLSFVVRRDTQFDDQDCIVVVLRAAAPGAGAVKDGTERRIDIFPSSTGVGAGVPGGVEGPDHLRENRDPRNVEYYRWDVPTSAWVNMGAGSVNNVSIKVRSWDFGVNNKNWSVEVRLPTTIAQGGANWINLASSFGFYFNAIRLCSGAECSFDPTPFDGGSFQFTWPRANYATGDGLITGVTALDQAPIPLTVMGEAFLGTVAGCAGVTGVKFQNGANSIGVLSGGVITNAIAKISPNNFVARIVNTATTSAQAVQATFRIANWGVGPGDNNKWNLVPARGGANNPTAGASIPVGGAPVDLTMQWQLDAAEQALYGGALSNHQCIWVLLDSVQAVDFVESSIRRNCNFVNLSEHEQGAEVSGDGYPPPPNGAADQEIVLIVSQMRMGRVVPSGEVPDVIGRNNERFATGTAFRGGKLYAEQTGGSSQLFEWLRIVFGGVKIIYDWVWISDGYRKTEYELTLSGKQYRVFEPIGAFGYLADHEGLVAEFTQSITPAVSDAARFEVAGPDAYRLRVPNGGKVNLVTRLAARPYKSPRWLWLLLLLILLLIVYLIWQLF